MTTPARNARTSSSPLIGRRGVDGADVHRGGSRESVWIRPARRYGNERAGGGPRLLFGRLGHGKHGRHGRCAAPAVARLQGVAARPGSTKRSPEPVNIGARVNLDARRGI
jgi:hypothetical protein